MDSTTRNDDDNNIGNNNNNNFGIPLDATCDVSTSSSTTSSSSSISPAVLSFPPNGQIVIGIESRVYKSHNYLLVGRQASTCDIRITHKSLSRQHSILYYYHHQSHNKQLFLKDLETKSGTYVNQRRLSKSEIYSLQHGDTIQFGKAKPIFTLNWKDHQQPTTTTTTTTTTTDTDTAAAGNNNNNQIDDQQQQQQQQQQNDVEDEKEEEEEETTTSTTSLLTGRAQREAEIAKMMATLDDKPTYTIYKERPTNQSAAAAAVVQDATTNNKNYNKNIERYKLPVSQVTSSSPIFEDDVGDNNNNNNTSSSSSLLATIAMDPTGARFAFGCRDSSLRIYDFAGGYSSKTNTYRPFQNIYVEEGYPCSSICYSPTSGDRILVTTTSIQPKIFDRDGNEELQFVRGDVYVRDPTKTIGHTNELVDCSWHPGVQKSIVHTISKDGSWKIWNVDNGKLSFGMLKCTDTVLIKNLKSQQKTIPTCIIATPTSVVVGTECGSLQIYNYPITSKLRPQQSLILPTTTTTTTTTDNNNGDDGNDGGTNNNNKVATTSHDVVQCIAVSADSTKIATRTESFVCIWDLSSKRLSSSSKPILQLSGLPLGGTNNNNNPTIAFSPNGKVLCVGVSELMQQSNDQNDNNNKKRMYWNSIQFYAIPSSSSTTKVKKKPIYKCYMGGNDDGEGGGSTTPTPAESPLLGLFWHIKLNQILVTTTKEFVIWYDESYSKKGILLNPQFASSSSTRKRKKNDRGSGEDALQELYASRAPPPGSTIKADEILVPNALPLFGGETAKTKRQRRLEKEEIENSKQMPQKPSKDIYTTNNTLFAQLVMDQRGGKQKRIAGKDPREALAQYNEGKSYISSAYEGNQERILADKTVEEEEDEMKNKKK